MVEQEDQSLKVEKRILLVEGDTFTEMEKVGLEWLNQNTMYKETVSIEGIKIAKIQALYCNETLAIDIDRMFSLTEYTPEDVEGRFWELTAQFEEELDSGKIKFIKEKYIMPANSQKDAITRLEKEFSKCEMPWKIINGKETAIYAALVYNDTHSINSDKLEVVG